MHICTQHTRHLNTTLLNPNKNSKNMTLLTEVKEKSVENSLRKWQLTWGTSSCTPWLWERPMALPSQSSLWVRKRHQALLAGLSNMAHGLTDLEKTEVTLVVLAEDEPTNYREAMQSSNALKWRKSFEEEYETLLGYHTWNLVKRPPNINIVGSWWTFRVKRNNLGQVDKYKAQLIAQGFSQVSGLDFNETFSPTIRFTSICFILAMACCYNLKLRHIDVKGTYLNGILDDDVYMRQPKGFIKPGEEHLVCKLK